MSEIQPPPERVSPERLREQKIQADRDALAQKFFDAIPDEIKPNIVMERRGDCIDEEKHFAFFVTSKDYVNAVTYHNEVVRVDCNCDQAIIGTVHIKPNKQFLSLTTQSTPDLHTYFDWYDPEKNFDKVMTFLVKAVKLQLEVNQIRRYAQKALEDKFKEYAGGYDVLALFNAVK
jgi:hypothetical protein